MQLARLSLMATVNKQCWMWSVYSASQRSNTSRQTIFSPILLLSSGLCRKKTGFSVWILPVTFFRHLCLSFLSADTKISSAVLIKLGWPHKRTGGFFKYCLCLARHLVACSQTWTHIHEARTHIHEARTRPCIHWHG